jgi:hypothetical protein
LAADKKQTAKCHFAETSWPPLLSNNMGLPVWKMQEFFPLLLVAPQCKRDRLLDRESSKPMQRA